MAIPSPRIIIVEENQGIGLLVRASLALLNRRPRLIETPTGDDAWDELQLRAPDLLITAQALNGSLSGPQLALQAKKAVAAMPVIVLGSETDDEPTSQDLASAPFQYLRRPLMPELFIRAIRVALDGPEAVPPESVSPDLMGPVPLVDSDKLRPLCDKMMRESQAMCYILADRNGRILIYGGMAGYFDRDLLAAALAPTFAATAQLAPILGERPRVLKYYDGDKYDVYGLAVGAHHFLSLAFDGTTGNRALGNVARLGRTIVDEMTAVIGTAAYQIQTLAVGLAPAAPLPQAAPVAPDPLTQPRGRRRNVESELLPAVDPVVMPQMDPIINFDPRILDSLDSVDLSAAETLFDPILMAGIANSLGSANRISRDDAQAQGIITWDNNQAL